MREFFKRIVVVVGILVAGCVAPTTFAGTDNPDECFVSATNEAPSLPAATDTGAPDNAPEYVKQATGVLYLGYIDISQRGGKKAACLRVRADKPELQRNDEDWGFTGVASNGEMSATTEANTWDQGVDSTRISEDTFTFALGETVYQLKKNAEGYAGTLQFGSDRYPVFMRAASAD